MSKKEVMEEVTEGYDREILVSILKNFDNSGIDVFDAGRNKIRKFTVIHEGKEKEINVKSFRKKNYFTRMVYKYIKGSKAERSYTYAKKLLSLGINTPEPIGYFENFPDSRTGKGRSFFISEHLTYDLTGRELFWDEEIRSEKKGIVNSEKDEIIRQFTEYTFKLHEKGVEFKDYSPGNLLIRRERENKYSFYIVDLNRMKFYRNLEFDRRLKNVSKMMEYPYYVKSFSEYYSRLCDRSSEEVYKKFSSYVKRHKFYVKLKDNTRTFRNFFKIKR